MCLLLSSKMGYIYRDITFCPYHPASIPQKLFVNLLGICRYWKKCQFITIWIFFIYCPSLGEGRGLQRWWARHTAQPPLQVCREERERRERVCASALMWAEQIRQPSLQGCREEREREVCLWLEPYRSVLKASHLSSPLPTSYRLYISTHAFRNTKSPVWVPSTWIGEWCGGCFYCAPASNACFRNHCLVWFLSVNLV